MSSSLPSHCFASLSLQLVPPIVTIQANELIGIVNKPVTLNCQVDGHPFPTIFWTKGGRSVDTQPGKKKKKMNVPNRGYLLCKLLFFPSSFCLIEKMRSIVLRRRCHLFPTIII